MRRAMIWVDSFLTVLFAVCLIGLSMSGSVGLTTWIF